MKPEIPVIKPGRSHREAVRRLLRERTKATLATTMTAAGERDPGAPYASLVTFATDHDASPILLLSGLSDHTRNLAADPRAALLLDDTDGLPNPQTGARATVMGRIDRLTTEADIDRCRRRFLARHPAAALYAGFGDFGFFRMTITRVHFVGGFARAVWLDDPADALTPPDVAAALVAAEAGICGHMNDDHAEAVALYATRLLGRDGEGWQLAALDADGCDLVRGEEAARLPFPQPLTDAGDARRVLVELARQARAATDDGGTGGGTGGGDGHGHP